MKSFENIDAKSVKEAVGLLQKFHQQKKAAAVVGGGSEVLAADERSRRRTGLRDQLKNHSRAGLHQRRARRFSHRRAGQARGHRRTSGDPRKAADPLRRRRRRRVAADPQRRHHRRQSFASGRSAGIFAHRTSPVCARADSSVTRSRAMAAFTRSSVPGRATSCIRRTPRRRWSRSARKLKSSDRRVKKPFPLEKFFVLPSVDYKRENILNPGEIVTEIYRADAQGRQQRLSSQSARTIGLGSRHRRASIPLSKAAAAWCATRAW